MSYIPKNYNTDGGDRTVIGGTLEFTEDAQVIGFPGNGAFTPAANQPTLTATEVSDVITAFNGLLTKLKTAGLMEADT